MATVWTALTAEALVLLTVAFGAVKWVRRPQVSTSERMADSTRPHA